MPRPLKLRFPGAGGNRLAAILDRPDALPRAHALYAHCFTCTKDIKAAYWIGQALAAHGVATLRFDFTGLGESEGDFGATGLSTNVEDLLAAAAHLEREQGPPRLLIGHSLGGVAVLAAASAVPGVRAVATIGTPFESDHIDDPDRYDMARVIGALGLPLLVLHAPEDEVVPVAQAGLIFRAARHPRSFVALDGADHLLSRRPDAEWTAGLLLAWAEKYLA